MNELLFDPENTVRRASSGSILENMKLISQPARFPQSIETLCKRFLNEPLLKRARRLRTVSRFQDVVAPNSTHESHPVFFLTCFLSDGISAFAEALGIHSIKTAIS
jgi:hypothetical protein